MHTRDIINKKNQKKKIFFYTIIVPLTKTPVFYNQNRV